MKCGTGERTPHTNEIEAGEMCAPMHFQIKLIPIRIANKIRFGILSARTTANIANAFIQLLTHFISIIYLYWKWLCDDVSHCGRRAHRLTTNHRMSEFLKWSTPNLHWRALSLLRSPSSPLPSPLLCSDAERTYQWIGCYHQWAKDRAFSFFFLSFFHFVVVVYTSFNWNEFLCDWNFCEWGQPANLANTLAECIWTKKKK